MRFRNASGFKTNSSHTKRVTSKRVVTKAAEAAVRCVPNGANPVKIGGSVAEVHLRE